MTKFIPSFNGHYVNIDKITKFAIDGDNNEWCVKFFTHGYDDFEWEIMKGLPTEEKAQEWLDNFMKEYELCL